MAVEKTDAFRVQPNAAMRLQTAVVTGTALRTQNRQAGRAVHVIGAATPFLNRHNVTIVGRQGFLAFSNRHIGIGL
jgi:hypothetical protein